MRAELRQMGIGVVGDVPWGSHFFFFQETKEDLLDALVPYFKAGLENKERCIWVISDPLTEEDVWHALERSVPNYENYLQDGSMQILDSREWYLTGDNLDLRKVLRAWSDSLKRALAEGYSGLRVSGDTTFLENKDIHRFSEYETELNHFVRDKQILVLCSYPLGGSSASVVLDIARTHQFVIARRNRRWEMVETSELKQAKTEIKKLNDELSRRVIERTQQLTVANERMRQLSISLMDVQETERAHLARELHDEVGQLLTGLRLLLKRNRNLPDEAFDVQIEQAQAIVGDLLARVRGLSFDLRPAALNQFGLLPALLTLFERYTSLTGVVVQFQHQGVGTRFSQRGETGAYRIVQEALTNTARHAGVSEVTVKVWTDAKNLNLQIEDRGRGFDPEVVLRAPRSTGLTGMQERTKGLGGILTIESSPGAGTTIAAEVPLDGAIVPDVPEP